MMCRWTSIKVNFLRFLALRGAVKTTLMRLLAGFETPDSGKIILDGQDISQIPPYLRPVNMMFSVLCVISSYVCL